MEVNKSNDIPLYIQLKNLILSKIKLNEYQTNLPIPSERQLADELSISRMTVRQAYRILEAEGMLYRIKGRGTFVSKPVFEQRNIMSFTTFVKDKGFTPVTKVLLFETIDPDEHLKKIFSPGGSAAFNHIKRLRLADDAPLALEEVYIPSIMCPGAKSSDFRGSLHEYLLTHHDHRIVKVDSTITALLPDKEQKALFELNETIPLLSVTSLNYDQRGAKIYYESSLYRSDEFKYSFSLNLG